MSESISTLEELIAIRKDERDDEERNRILEMTAKIDAALGARVVDALTRCGLEGWKIGHASAVRRFTFKKGEFHLTMNSLPGATRVDVEIRHVDSRFVSLAKKTEINEVCEDWFLNSIEMLSTQILERLQNPMNFI